MVQLSPTPFSHTTHGKNAKFIINRTKFSTPFSIQSTYDIDKRALV